MNRRGFLGTLFAGAIAAVIPAKAENPTKFVDLWKATPEELRGLEPLKMPTSLNTAELSDLWKSSICQKAPRGWRCTRIADHDGPCAAELAPAWKNVLPDENTPGWVKYKFKFTSAPPPDSSHLKALLKNWRSYKPHLTTTIKKT